MVSCAAVSLRRKGRGEQTASSWGEFLIKAPWGSWQRQPGRWGNSGEHWSQCLPPSPSAPDHPESVRWKGRTEGDKQGERRRGLERQLNTEKKRERSWVVIIEKDKRKTTMSEETKKKKTPNKNKKNLKCIWETSREACVMKKEYSKGVNRFLDRAGLERRKE